REPAAAEGAVIVVDQFEEVFTLCTDQDERARFLDLLLAVTVPRPNGQAPDPTNPAASPPSPRGPRVVLAVRADFFGHCATHLALAEAFQGAVQLVTPMTPDELREAVVKPAATANLIVERALTARIVREVGDEPGGLPLMSHALLETWRRRQGRALTEAAYEAAGGIHGAIARTAEELYERFGPAEADAARRILLRLVAPGRGTQDTRRPTAHAELTAGGTPETGRVLERLARARLITLEESVVDLAHEALLTAWPRLLAWIGEDRELLHAQRHLTEAAENWRSLGRDPGALYRGLRLDTAEAHFGGPGAQDGLTPLEREFLAAARADRTRDRRHRRGRTVALSLLLVIALVAGLAAWQQNRAAERRRIEAEARRIASVAASLRATDPVTAMRLGLAAWRLADLPESRSAVLAAMAQPDQDVFTDPQNGADTRRRLSDDGRTLISVGAEEVVTWDLDTHRRTATRPGLGAEVRAAATPRNDSTTLAHHAEDGSVSLRDLSTGRQDPLTGPVKDGAESDGRYIVVYDHTDDEYTARVWNLADRRPVLDLRAPRDPTRPDVGTVSTRMSETTTRSVEHRMEDLAAPDVALSPDGRTAAFCVPDGPLQLWDLVGLRRIDAPWAPTPSRLECSDERVSFSPDGRLMVLAAERGVRWWDIASGVELPSIRLRSVQEIAFSADGRFLATATTNSLLLWRTDSPDGPVFSYNTSGEALTELRIDPARGLIRYLGGLAAGQGTTVHTLDMRTAVADGWRREETPVARFSPDGTLLATVAPPAGHSVEDGGAGLRILDGRTGDPVAELPVEPCPSPCSPLLDFSVDGTLLAHVVGMPRSPGDGPPPVRLWDTVRRRPRGSLDPRGGFALRRPASAAIGPAGRWAVLTGPARDGSFRDLRGEASPAVVLPEVGGSRTAVRPDGGLLVTSTGKVLDMSAEPPAAIASGPGPSDVLEFNADGTLLATGDSTGAVVLWDGQVKRRVGTLARAVPESPGPVTALAFSRDSRTLAVATLDGSVQLWDLAANQPIGLPLPSAGDTAHALAFSPDGTTLHASGRHVPLQRLAISPAAAADHTCRRAGGSLTAEEWRTHLPGTPHRPTCP
ncbi:hypothetical protein, partial [Kitasatospora putterlickiae]